MSRPTTKNKAFLGAYERGRRDRRAGVAWEDCPYRRAQAHRRGAGTWSAIWRTYWKNGWRDENIEMMEAAGAAEAHA